MNTSAIHAALRDIAVAWRDADPDPATRAEIDTLLDGDDAAGLTDRFGARLQFGTAGLRGVMGAGPNRMNRVMVRRTAHGVGSILRAHDVVAARGVVIGFDARHNSRVFAADAAAVLAQQGYKVYLFQEFTPTPLLAFAVRALECGAGLQITASHNPAADNGIKVYWTDGAQIVPPLDAEISAAIDAAPAAVAIAEDSPLIATVPERIVDEYLRGAAGVDVHTSTPGQRAALRIVHTAMHGVGTPLVRAVLAAAGFTDVHSVAAQADADPDFPTVAFPNPEEPGAMDLAVAQGAATDADVVLANDPDADRLAVAIPDGTGGWRVLRGDEIGWLLAEHLLDATEADGANRLLITTVVSSSLLATMAKARGVHFTETLTGFKWLARAWMAQPGRRMVLAYEEALGFAVGDLVRDKDGITAALVFADLAAAAKAEGASLVSILHDIDSRYGRHVTKQLSLRLAGADTDVQMRNFMAALRARPLAQVGNIAVSTWLDLLDATPPADLIVVGLADGTRVIVRPSGTEPKVKVYVETKGGGADTRADAVVMELRDILTPH